MLSFTRLWPFIVFDLTLHNSSLSHSGIYLHVNSKTKAKTSSQQQPSNAHSLKKEKKKTKCNLPVHGPYSQPQEPL